MSEPLQPITIDGIPLESPPPGSSDLEVAIRELLEAVVDNTRALERIRREMAQPLPMIQREGRP